MKTVESVAEYIAPYVGLSWPNDRQRIFEILSLVQNKIWVSGKFYNSTKWFYVNLRSNKTIITPHGYNVLLGCNINFKPVNINDKYFLFHRNGPGELPLEGHSNDVMFLGDEPVFKQPSDIGCDTTITVIGQPCNGLTAKTRISALHNGKPMYSYIVGEKGEPCLCEENTEEFIRETEAIEGIEFPTNGIVTFEHICFDKIYNIIKEPTLSPVEYYALDKCSRVGTLIARLEPFETISNYKLYQVNNNCIRNGQVLGLFKQSKPIDINSEHQLFISDNMLAVLSIAKGIHLKIEKDDIVTGEGYIMDGIRSLAQEVREQNGNPQRKMQVDSNRNFSKLPQF